VIVDSWLAPEPAIRPATGPDDPNVCLLRITPLTAELWDGPASKAVAAFEFVKARPTGASPISARTPR
jgi:hypothetical protein